MLKQGPHFGEHLTIDGYSGDMNKLSSKELVLGCLNELPQKLGMRKLAGPFVAWAEPNGKKDPGGWSGIVIIAESHISIHTFPRRGFLSADVYTCKNGLDVQVVISYFKDRFGLKSIERHFIKRGKRYPANNLA